MANPVLILIPTYNERENVQRLYEELASLSIQADILFLDDNSPDGTGALLDAIAGKDSRVAVIHRAGKLGIGSAHQAGIRYAYEKGYRYLVTMDCDFTHPPAYIPAFLDHAQACDVVVGSRYMDRESLADWNWYRKFLTHLGHFLTTLMLKMPYDASGAFRVYSLSRIDLRVFDRVQSISYSFFFESLCLLCMNGARVKEIPISLPRRTYGHSKMRFADIFGSLRKLLVLWWRFRVFPEDCIVSPPRGDI
jgi:dolichol-phosphate mannosyltransferase